MFSDQTYEVILERMFDRIPDDIDKRENSVIWNALAPAAAELAMSYIWLSQIPILVFADTAEGEYLERRTAEFGTNRKRATAARKRGLFFGEDDVPFDVPIGSRYFINDLYYVATERLLAGQYVLSCESVGTVGNRPTGPLQPLNNYPGLVRAEIKEIIAAGEDEETDEALRSRHYQMVNEPAFGGNISDYRHKVNAITGVGGTKVFPVWQGGGTVKCVFIGADFLKPVPELVSSVQEIIDPEVNKGQGLGVAPIGHIVTIQGVQDTPISVETTVSLESGVTLHMVRENVIESFESYFDSLRHTWEVENHLVVRTSQLEARLLTVPGVIDVQGTMLNGESLNVEIDPEYIPVLEGVVLNE